MRRTWTAALIVVALAGVAAGCGGSSDEQTDPTAAWASGFCSAVTTWTDDLRSITQQFTDTSNLSQDGLASAAEDARTSTDQLVSSLKDLGAPDTDSGQEVKSALDTLSTTLDAETAQIQETAQGVTGITDLPSAITKISTSLSALGTAFSDTLQTIETADTKGELKTALEDSPDCADISS
jgi:phage-related protein